MSPEQHSLARRIFEEALQQAEDQRSAYLQTASQGDQEVAQEALRLLDARSQASSFLSTDTHPSLRFGRYVVARELGRGGMGIVYEAIDPQIGRHLAIKIINFQAFTTVEETAVLRERLFREARSAGALSHPGIVVIYDVGEDEQMAYIAMELVDGPSLHQILASGERLDPAEVLDILRQAAAALDHAHKCGIVHRDIKPANIMLHQKSQVKIADFGIAKITFEPKYTMTGTSMGTPDYMSPEQIEAQPTDGRSDQFSLAVVAYELLTGATPFQGGSFAAVLHRIVAGPRPSASAANPALPAGVDDVLRRAMAQLPVDRYATCAEFVQALGAAMQPAATVTLPIQPVVPVQPVPVQPVVPVQAAVPPVPDVPVQAAPPVQPRRDKRLLYVLAGVLALAAVLAGAAYRLQLFPKSPGVAQSAPVPAVVPAPPASQISAEQQPAHPIPVEAPPPKVTHPAAQTKPAGGEASASSAQPQPKPVNAPSPPADLPPPQPVDAVRRLNRAAEAGDAEAMDRLGQMYEHGSGGLPRDATEAFRWYNKGAAAGQANALYHLGTLYEAGVATPKNLNEATRLYQRAAAAGNMEARARLSQLPAAAARPAPKTASVAPIPRGAIAIQVPANVAWTDTGIHLRAGNRVAVTASGLVAVEAGGRIPPKAPGGFAPDCRAAAAIYGGRFGAFPAPELPCWSLIGRVGANGAIFEVGARGTFQVRSDGRLLLGINDDSLANNSGFWTAAITVEH
jgi:serine/threonine-protein kinase